MTVKQYQYLYTIQQANTDDIDRLALSICYLYNLQEAEVNLWSANKFGKYCKKLGKKIAIKTPYFTPRCYQLDAEKITFGQFIECQTWIKGNTVKAIHMVAASILKSRGTHAMDSEMILQRDINNVLQPVNTFLESMLKLTLKFKWLFGEDKAKPGEKKTEAHPFLTNFGWVFSAKQVAEHLGITINEAYGINIIEALNTLSYLKASGQYQTWIAKQT